MLRTTAQRTGASRVQSFRQAAALLLVTTAWGQDDKKLEHAEFPASGKPLTGVVVDANGENIYATTSDGTLRAWGVRKRDSSWGVECELPVKARLINQAAKGREPFVIPLAVGRKILILTTGDSVAFTAYDLATGQRVGGHGGPPHADQCTGLVCDPRDRWTWLGTDGGTVTRFLPRKIGGFWQRHLGNDGVSSMALDNKGDLLAVGGCDGSIRFVDSKSTKIDKKRVLKNHSEAVTALAWGRRGMFIMSGDAEGGLLVSSHANGEVRCRVEGHDATLRTLAVHPSGKWSASGDADGNILLWDSSLGKVLRRATHPGMERGGVFYLAFVERGRRLLSAAGTKLLLWDVSNIGN